MTWFCDVCGWSARPTLCVVATRGAPPKHVLVYTNLCAPCLLRAPERADFVASILDHLDAWRDNPEMRGP